MIVIDMSGISFSTLYHIGIIKQVGDDVARHRRRQAAVSMGRRVPYVPATAPQ
eukprot:COSAG01_NODE_4739_length_4782_cov_2.805467_4_plen_53_part_00